MTVVAILVAICNPYPGQPSAWLRHIPYLRATQTLRLRCRVCAVRTHAVLSLPNDSKPCRNPIGSKRSLGHVPTKLNIKGRLKNNFQTASLYQKRPALSKIEVQAAFHKN